MGGCSLHHITDNRGGSAETLAVPNCTNGVEYGAWSEFAGGFIHTGDCAMDVANDAIGELEADDEITILAMCREHTEQPADSCEECEEGEIEDNEEEDGGY